MPEAGKTGWLEISAHYLKNAMKVMQNDLFLDFSI